MKKLSYFSVYFVFIFISLSCSLLGVHFKPHNPTNPGKFPKFDEETILLGELTKYKSCFDVYYYDLSVDIDPSNKFLNGSVEIYAIAKENFDTLQIDLHQNFEITQLYNLETNKPLDFNRKHRAVFIAFPNNKDKKFSLKIHYNGKPIIAKKPPWKGGFVWEKDTEKNPWIGVACESIGASVWWPLKDHTSDEPDSMRLHYSIPKELIAVGNGQLESSNVNPIDSTKLIYNWFISYPINTYNVTVYVGKYELLKDEYIGINGKILPLNHYVLKNNYEKAKKHFKQLHSQLKLYELRFGEYPWYNDGFKLVESPYAGMEHQTAIAYGNKYKNDLTDSIDYIILHETAHEWWGNSVTSKDLSDVWLQEGFATYAEALYMESINFDAYLNHLYFLRIFIKNKYPLIGVKDRRYFHFRKSSDVYTKGAWVLHTLRIQLNDDKLFFDIIKTFATKYKEKIITSKEFIELVNEKTKQDYNWFFNQYLYKNKIPTLEYCTNLDGVLYYRWDNTSDDFNQLKIKLKSNNQAITLTPSTKTQKIKLPKDEYGAWDYQLITDVLYAYKKNKSLISN